MTLTLTPFGQTWR